MKCWNCGGETDRSMQFCKWCGAELERTQQYSQMDIDESIRKQEQENEETLAFHERSSARVTLDHPAVENAVKRKAVQPKKKHKPAPLTKTRVRMKAKYDLFLLAACGIGLFYILFEIIYNWNMLFDVDADMEFFLPHIAGMLFALIITGAGLFLKQEGFLLAGAVLFTTASLFHVTSMPLVILCAVLVYLGYYRQYLKNKRASR